MRTRISCTNNRVKTEGRTKYLKCSKLGCDGSAKIIGDLFFLGVRTFLCYYSYDRTSMNVFRVAV